jgi:hypothetical protein
MLAKMEFTFVRYKLSLVDDGDCSLKFQKEGKVLANLERYDFFGPINYLKEIKKIQLSKKYTTLSVVAESSEVTCLFMPLHK